ncbi:hypothetical protein H257_16318 [Aphanomyces astaci]|uniref:ABC transporter domain-containing protein n=1 Tax=Aphanomyces astaci TaxID=112090 RepID=W4FKN4_APHAT|nr:hypothetical protein H257_16318 [Aphanomyces astaci]ETV67436.1 hypothetical protein H257_16318 [Aphanomyces astaci]|eukprot:XP_009842995.1 hypothetical protein H257_16318 [Aphanomyces astaci]
MSSRSPPSAEGIGKTAVSSAPRSHTRALLWKNYLLKKKHPIKWAFEVLLPVAFIVLLAGLKTLTDNVRIPAGWSEAPATSLFSTGPTEGNTFNLFAKPTPSLSDLLTSSSSTFRTPKYFLTETTMSGILVNLAATSFADGIRMNELTSADRRACQTRVVFQGAVNVDPTSPNALPRECRGKVVPYKLAIIPDNAFTRSYFAATLSQWYPRVDVGRSGGLNVTIPGFNDSVIFFNSTDALDAYVTGNTYGKDSSNPKIFAGLVFNEHPTTLGVAGSIDYTLRFNSTAGRQGSMGDVPKTSRILYDPYQRSITTSIYSRYTQRGFMTLQTAVARFATCVPVWNGTTTSGECTQTNSRVKDGSLDSRFLVQVQNDLYLNKLVDSANAFVRVTNNNNSTISSLALSWARMDDAALELLALPLRQAPQPVLGSAVFPLPIQAYTSSPFYTLVDRYFALVFVISYLYAISSVLVALIHEKETKSRELLKIMGVSERAIVLSWYATYGGVFLAAAVLQAAAGSVNLFPNTNVLLSFVFFFVFGLAVLSYGFMVSALFSKARTGAYVGIIGFFGMYLVSAAFTPDTDERVKTWSCLLAPVALSFGTSALASAETNSLGLSFANASDPFNNFRFATSLWMLAVDVVLYTLLGMYFELVVPKEYGVPLPWHFPCTFWMKSRQAPPSTYALADTHDNDKDVPMEDMGLDMRLQETSGDALSIQNLRKVFAVPGGVKVAVKGINLTMYKNQITCLLGHNGAGKTTLISMLTGMIPATSGDATVHGLSLRRDLPTIRRSLGMCPQHDVLYGELTVHEHLSFYGQVKGYRGADLDAQVDAKIVEVGLTEKRQVKASDLSGGMKRKLSLAIALLGDSQVVFLDEPTSGMDPYSRRSSWEIILNNRYNRIIVLTTHFMDEADILGDRIAIMAEGELRCCGSSLFLKNRYGAGYNFSLVKTDDCDTDALMAFVRSHVDTAKVLSNVGTEVSFQLPLDCSHLFAPMFVELDANLAHLGVLSYGISVTTLEEVFIKVAELGDVGQQHTLQPRNDHVAAVKPEPFALQTPRFADHFRALFLKRFRTARRDKRMVLFGALLPVVFLTLGVLLLNYSSLTKNDMAMAVNTDGYPQQRGATPYFCAGGRCSDIFANIANGKRLDIALPVYTSSTPTVFNVTYTNPSINETDTTGFCLRAAEEAFREAYNSNNNLVQFGGFVAQSDPAVNVFGYNVMVNTTATHSAIVYKAMLDHALVQSLSSSSSASSSSPVFLRVTSHPLPLTSASKLLFTTFLSFIATIFIAIAFAFFTASIVPYLVHEKHPTHNSKHQQLVSGVSLPAFWLATYAWDLLFYAIPGGFGLGVIYLFEITPFTGKDCATCTSQPFAAVAVVFVLFGFALCSFCYCLSYLFVDSASSQTYVIMVNIFLGVVLMTISQVLDVVASTTEINKSLKFIWRLSPLFNLGNALNNLSVQSLLNSLFSSTSTKSSFDLDVTGWEIAFLAGEAVVFPLVAIGIDYALSFPKIKAMIAKDPVVMSAPMTIDDDVAAEGRRVAGGDVDDYAVVMQHLRKVYKGGKVGLNDLTLALPKGECFGYLGINGAGKTSTMKILTGDVLPTSGSATLGGFDIMSQQIEVRRLIGYCPQFDALIDLLTVREHLELFASIKGVPSKRICDTVKDKMDQMNLNDFEHKLAGTLSGGNKRKLSVAIALIGSPPIIFLDEPSTGMDPVSRRFMWDVIADISTRSKESTILLTTHSMEECEALCSRVGIMVGGSLSCLGSIQHLKNRFGDGMMMHVWVAPVLSADVDHMISTSPSLEGVATLTKDQLVDVCASLAKPHRADQISMEHATGYVLAESLGRNDYVRVRDFCAWWLSEDRFEKMAAYLGQSFGEPNVLLLERQNDLSRFKLVGAKHTLALSNVFSLIESTKTDLHVKEYTVSQTTLEQIFNNFASQQTQEMGVARGVEKAAAGDHYQAMP